MLDIQEYNKLQHEIDILRKKYESMYCEVVYLKEKLNRIYNIAKE